MEVLNTFLIIDSYVVEKMHALIVNEQCLMLILKNRKIVKILICYNFSCLNIEVENFIQCIYARYYSVNYEICLV